VTFHGGLTFVVATGIAQGSPKNLSFGNTTTTVHSNGRSSRVPSAVLYTLTPTPSVLVTTANRTEQGSEERVEDPGG